MYRKIMLLDYENNKENGDFHTIKCCFCLIVPNHSNASTNRILPVIAVFSLDNA